MFELEARRISKLSNKRINKRKIRKNAFYCLKALFTNEAP